MTTPTPRTDAAAFYAGDVGDEVVRAEICRGIENDLHIARIRAEDWHKTALKTMSDLAAREEELAAMKQGKALADGMANMIRGFILKRVERETLDESAAKYRKWEEDYCHSTPAKLDRAIAAEQRAEAAERELASVKAELARLRRPIQYPITTVTGCATDQLFRGHEPGCPVLTAAGNPVCTCYRAAHPKEGA